MSRIAKTPIAIPANTEVKVVDNFITVKGPKGELKKAYRPNSVNIVVADNTVTLSLKKTDIESRALWGTYASHLRNMLEGVNTPFVKKLILEGIGYKAEVQGTTLKMALGFSHPVNVEIPAGLTVASEKGTITITGIDKETVGQFAASLRAMKKPEPYKGKGFRYEGEIIRRKQGKKAA